VHGKRLTYGVGISDVVFTPHEVLREPMAGLPTAAQVLEFSLPVRGQCAVQLFAGGCTITLCLLLPSVLCIDEFDVLRNGQVLVDMVAAGLLVAAHMETLSQSFTWARQP